MTGLYVASNATALGAQFNLTRNMGALGETLTRLSTGLRINSGKDDPAGLIASELLKAQITGTNKAITNTQRANSLMAMADSGLAQIGNLLNDIKGLVVESANTGTMTAAQIAANQMQVDAALDSIDRIARTTNYGGKKLLDGSLGFQTAGMGPGIGNVQINSANFGTADAVGVNVNVQAAADYARLTSYGTGVGVDTVFDVIGNIGSATVSVGAGSTNDDIAAAINRSSDSTGVLAYVEGKESYGSIVLSSAGSGNDILVTALQAGLDNGNYEFRITRGDVNDARIVQEAAGGQPGIVEISLVSAYESRYNNFAGLFDINVDTTGRDNPETARTSVTMQQGAANNVTYNSVEKAAATNVINGKSLIANVNDAKGNNINSQLNGWTIAVDDRIATEQWHSVSDTNTKTIYVNSESFGDSLVLNEAIKNALANTVDGTVGDFDLNAEVDLKIIGNKSTFSNGDRFTFAGGAAEGELSITYAAGATANDILKLLNAAPNVSASLATGVNGSATIANQPNGLTSVHNNGQNLESRFSSGATSQEVIDLINSKLGDKFMATGLASDTGTGGRVSFMDASAIHGDINLGNALRFSGMDNGPIVRLTTLGTNGMPVANQKLGVNIIHPTDADKLAGIHTPILEIRLATDAQGNSITMASDITKLFNSLTQEQTMGVSVSQLYPPGLDPNGRVFGVDECGNAVVIDNCPTPIDGIVQPTGFAGLCGPQEGDLVLLGGNQMIVADNAVAKIAGHNRPLTTPTDPVRTIAIANPPPPTVDFGSLFTFDYDTAVALANAGISFEVVPTERLPQSDDGDGKDGDDASVTYANGVVTIHRAQQGQQAETAGDTDGADGNTFANLDALWSQITAAINSDPANNITLNTDNSRLFTGVDLTRFEYTGANFAARAVAADIPATAYGPTLELDADAARMLSGITFEFIEGDGAMGVGSRWNEERKTLTVDLGNAWDNTAGDADEKLLDAIKDAIIGGGAGLAKDSVFNAMRGSLLFAPPELTAEKLAEKITVVEGSTVDTKDGSSTRAPIVTGRAQSAAVDGATSGVTNAEGDKFDFDFNGAKFRIESDPILSGDNLTDFNITFAAGGSTTAVWAGGHLTLTLAANFFDGLDTAGAFAGALQTLIDGATGAATEYPDDGSDPATGRSRPVIEVSQIGNSVGWGNESIPTGATYRDTFMAIVGTDPHTFATTADNAEGKTILTFDNTSAMNGMTFAFTRDETREGFNAQTGQLTVFLGPEFEKLYAAAEAALTIDDPAIKAADDALRAAVNGAIHANWESIRAFTGNGAGATNTKVLELDAPPKLAADQHEDFTIGNAISDAAASDNPLAKAADGKTMISGSYVEGPVTGQRGVGQDDAVMSITAKEAGTHMAGISIHFVNDIHSGLEEWNERYDAEYGAGVPLPELRVVLQTNTDGSRELIITGNLGTESKSELNAGLLARALNAAVIQDTATGKQFAFSSMFEANALQFAPGGKSGEGVAGSVLFNRDVSGAQGTTVGGYRVSSGDGSATSSGIGMLGQADANERLVIESQELGSSQFIQINMIDGYLNTVNAWGETSNYGTGQDMLATINGTRATTDGNHISINTADLSLSMNVANAIGNTGFTITGGGAMFQLGPDVVSQQQMRVGIASMLTTNLGGKDGYIYMLKEGGIAALNSSDAGRRLADRIVNQAIENVAVQRGRLGAIQKGSLEPNIIALQDSLTAMTEANALISNADFAVESSNLTRFQLLVQSGMQTLGIANQMPQYAAQLVR